MSQPTIEVLTERIESLDRRLEAGFEDIKKMIDRMQSHSVEDDRMHKELRDSIEKLRIDIEVFKARWSLLAVIGSALIAAGVNLVFKILGGKIS